MPAAKTIGGQPVRFLRETALTAAAGGALLVFCASLLLIDPGYFWTDDYQTANLPGLCECARAWSHGELPLLSPSAWRGGALAAEYPHGAFAPMPTLCVLAAAGLGLTLPLTAALVSAVHLAVLAAGAFRLARQRGLSVDLALLVAWVCSLNGFIFFTGGRIWVPHLISFAWVPWFWWALERTLAQSSGPARVILPGIFLTLVITAGWHFTVVMAGILSVWLLLRDRAQQRSWRSLWPTLGVWAIGLGLSAPAWMMFLEYIPSTARGQGNQVWFYTGWMVSLDSLTAFLFPHVTIAPIWDVRKPHVPVELFGGLVPLVILAAALIREGRAAFRALRWEWGLCAFLFVLAASPSIGNFRYSFRWLALFFLVLALIAGHTLARLRTANLTREVPLPNLGLWCFFLVLIVWCRALMLAPVPTLMMSSLALAFLLVSCLWLQVDARWAPDSFLRQAMPLCVVLATSWITFAKCAPFSEVATWPIGEQIREPGALDPGIRYASLYTLEDILDEDANRLIEPKRGKGVELYPGNLAMYSGLEFINGYSPTKPAGMESVLPFRDHGFVTVPDGERLLRTETGPRGLLSRLGVDGLVISDTFASSRPLLRANGWREAARVEGGTVLHREGRSPRVRAIEQAEVLPREAFATARLSEVTETRNSAQVEVADSAEGETLIVFSRPWYPGYRATLDGKALPVEVVDLMLPAVRLPVGARGRLVLEYRPRSLVLGGWTAALTGLVMVLISFSHNGASAKRIHREELVHEGGHSLRRAGNAVA
jgi:hypothetical protein